MNARTLPKPKRDATVADAFKAIVLTHECLDEHREETREAIEGLNDKIDGLTHGHIVLRDALGLNEGGVKRVATMTPFQAMWRNAAAAGGGIATVAVLYKLGALLIPVLITLALGVDHALRAT